MSAPVLQVIRSTARRGAEVFAVDLATALEARARQVQTVALTPGSAPDGLSVPTLGDRSLGLSTLRALRRRIKDTPLVISHGSRTLPACALAASGTGRRFVYRSIGDVISYAGTPARRARVTLALRRTSAVVALWSGAARHLAARHRVPTAKIHTIPTGVPAERFPVVDVARRSDARARLGPVADDRLALYLGSLTAEKNVAGAIEAVAATSDTGLVIAGGGPERPRLEALARDVAPGRVHFTGAVSDPADVLAVADVLVLPSLIEGMPAVLIEAGLSGLPVVATDVGAVREVVLDGETGLVVPPGDPAALSRALKDALVAPARLGGQARRHCLARFEIGVVAAAWDDLLRALEGS
jgi:glycosyltransferase involved in cell wall biosynthesis